jgi:hypothetical protein
MYYFVPLIYAFVLTWPFQKVSLMLLGQDIPYIYKICEFYFCHIMFLRSFLGDEDGDEDDALPPSIETQPEIKIHFLKKENNEK